ncbi:unnamed protein product [Eruca vesicaria subsp. sativa]|uniref:DUF7477 domain-containing protein n=1 Tax=Eruca vesicaria subsp. sativa TaxID=29727 RepID=A0ABC8L285_ERUVS|nr:unnamed protein product [Eruca vesicaria subsp. sativa]
MILLIAVKRLKSWSNKEEINFTLEVDILSHIRHKNFLSVRGYCNEGQERPLGKAAFVLSVPRRKPTDETKETLRTYAFPSNHVKKGANVRAITKAGKNPADVAHQKLLVSLDDHHDFAYFYRHSHLKHFVSSVYFFFL